MLKNKAGVPKLWNKHMSGCCDDIVLSIVVSEVNSDLRSWIVIAYPEIYEKSSRWHCRQTFLKMNCRSGSFRVVRTDVAMCIHTWSRFSVPLLKWMRCPDLLQQTRWRNVHISILHGSHLCCKLIQPMRSLVTWLITLLLIICPSSYKARPDNLIGPNSSGSSTVDPQRIKSRPNFPTSNAVGGAKFGWHPG